MTGGIQYIKNISQCCVQFVVYPPPPLYITSHQRAGLSREKAEGGVLQNFFYQSLYVDMLHMCDNIIYTAEPEI